MLQPCQSAGRSDTPKQSVEEALFVGHKIKRNKNRHGCVPILLRQQCRGNQSDAFAGGASSTAAGRCGKASPGERIAWHQKSRECTQTAAEGGGAGTSRAGGGTPRPGPAHTEVANDLRLQ